MPETPSSWTLSPSGADTGCDPTCRAIAFRCCHLDRVVGCEHTRPLSFTCDNNNNNNNNNNFLIKQPVVRWTFSGLLYKVLPSLGQSGEREGGREGSLARTPPSFLSCFWKRHSGPLPSCWTGRKASAHIFAKGCCAVVQRKHREHM